MQVQGELRPDPLISPLPARPVQEHVVPVVGHVFDQVVGETQVRRGQAQRLPELGILDLDLSVLDLWRRQRIQRAPSDWRLGGGRDLLQ